MILVHIHYHGQLRRSAGTASETLRLPQGDSLHGALQPAAESHGAPLREALFPQGGQLSLQLVTLHNQELVRVDRRDCPLADGHILRIFPRVSGG